MRGVACGMEYGALSTLLGRRVNIDRKSLGQEIGFLIILFCFDQVLNTEGGWQLDHSDSIQSRGMLCAVVFC